METKKRTPEEEALETSLHVYLRALSERPVTPRNLLELERATKLTRQILMVGQMQTTPIGGFENGSYIVGETLQMGSNVGYDAPIGVGSPPSETFGATVIREIVASIGKLTERAATPVPALPFTTHMSGADLVYAIAMAHEKGMKDLEDKLTDKLLAMADGATDSTLEPKENEVHEMVHP